MRKKNIAILLVIAIILTQITGCENLKSLSNNDKTSEEVVSNLPYYSVTNAKTVSESNYYMQIDADIPKIIKMVKL